MGYHFLVNYNVRNIFVRLRKTSVHLPRLPLIRVITPAPLMLQLAEIPGLKVFVLIEPLGVDHSEKVARQHPGTV